MKLFGHSIKTAVHRWFLFIVLIPSLLLNIFLLTRKTFSSDPVKQTIPGIKVIGVIDGDTLVLDGQV